MQAHVSPHRQRRRLFPRALLVGGLAGGVAVGFRWSLEGVDVLRDRLIAWAHQYLLWGWLLPVCVGALGAGVAVYLVRRVAPEAAGSGIPHLKAVLAHHRAMAWRSLLPVKFVGGVLAIGGGLTLGREGPTVQMGSAVGAAVAAWLGVSTRERQTLLAAGAGAGLAAAFNAPLAGVVFVLEELLRHFAPTIFGTAFVASLTADIVTRALTDQAPVFHMTLAPAPPLLTLAAFVVVGVLAGLLGVAFNSALLRALALFARLDDCFTRWGRGVPGLGGVLVGALIGGCGWFAPEALGGGRHLVDATLAGSITLASIPGWFLLRFVLTMGSYGCGAPGGIFAPLLILGGLIGLAVGQVTSLWLPGAVSQPGAFAVVGMAAYFAAIVRAPLTGIVLIVEMTNGYEQMLPLFVACFVAYAVAEGLGVPPIYDALVTRDLQRDSRLPAFQEPLVLEFLVHEGAPFEGKQVQELGLPEGCVLVTLHRDHYDVVPTAHTRLEAGNRLTVVLAPHASDALRFLHEGCTPVRH